LTMLAEANDSYRFWLLAGNPSTPLKLLTRLADNEGHQIRKKVAGNPSTPAKVLSLLANDGENEVRAAVAGNPNTPLVTWQNILESFDSDVEEEAAPNPKVDADASSCSSCNKPLPLDANFCQACGFENISRPAVCGKCGSECTPGAHFCGFCGNEINLIGESQEISVDQIRNEILSGSLLAMMKISELHPAQHQYQCDTCWQYVEKFDETIHETICASPHVTSELQISILKSSGGQIEAELSRNIEWSIVLNPFTDESSLFSVCESPHYDLVDAIREHPNCSARIREEIDGWF
jgi:hypothetical protein